MPEGSSSTMDALVNLVLLVLILGQILTTGESLPYQRTLRLCSWSLSDALYLVCKGRGYNEPFSYSGETKLQRPTGPGLVHECCHSPCSYSQLELYCKPSLKSEDQVTSYNTIEEPSFRIVNLPYSSVRELVTEEEYKESVGDATPTATQQKRKAPGRSSGKGIWKRKHWHAGNNKKGQKGRGEKGCRCRRRRPKRRRGGKVLRDTVIPNAPGFQVGTTSPEPIDSIVLFPSKSYVDFEEVVKDSNSFVQQHL